MPAPPARLLALLAASALLACADPAPSDPLPPAPTPQPTHVDGDTPRLPFAAGCVDLAPAERLLAASPEGDAWVFRAPSTDDAAAAELHVVQLERRERALPAPPVAAVASATAWSHQALTLVGDDHLWRVGAQEPEPLYLPTELGAPRAFCGDPQQDGDALVLTDAGLFERAAGQWWRVDLAGPVGLGDIAWIGRRDGACAGADGDVWLGAGDAVWRLAEEGFQRREPPRTPTGPGVAHAGGVALPAGEVLLLGDAEGWAEVVFEAPIERVAAAGERLWVATEEGLFVHDPSGWRGASVTLPARVDALHPHAAGGAWLRSGDALCHLAPDPLLRVRGLRPFERIPAGAVDLDVAAIDGAGVPLAMETLSVAIDGEPVMSIPVSGDGWRLEAFDLGPTGWHALELEIAAGDDVLLQRGLTYRVTESVSFAEALAPLAEARCAGSDCHGAGATDAPELLTHAQWVRYAPAIRAQVVSGRMPREPEAPLSPEEIDRIVEWIEGGLQP
ncbi:MAG TPA: hypothetical protein RMH85_05560 [Polyangiaceae bacterium LLY-WYZ-15_(1-7)]|nr:hypothetical protein [Myxococcales bacterium]MAT27586.1 hypothetical protein [Sandaracinus sp.]HJL05323.1 hypothetical protein [Polyangiaceae bacterium LLY-WYZ-15_(1-7)]HJL07941.1 hypothetical protein [Polyangiaceae bacterium LLY-WYZ-15_(1-7)]HJL25638.1 hypothetical protein [Polyangiaceae bacterium LLY-WYZ-15_(1-7)]